MTYFALITTVICSRHELQLYLFTVYLSIKSLTVDLHDILHDSKMKHLMDSRTGHWIVPRQKCWEIVTCVPKNDEYAGFELCSDNTHWDPKRDRSFCAKSMNFAVWSCFAPLHLFLLAHSHILQWGIHFTLFFIDNK